MKLLLRVFFSLFLIHIATTAQKVELEGYGAAGYRFYDRNNLNDYNQEAYYEGKLQVKVEYNDEIEMQLDFRGNSTDNSVNFREFSIELKYWKYLTLDIGNIKKPFGYEYLVNRDKLITVDRSYVSNTLGDLGYGSRAVSIMAFYEYDEDEPSFPFDYYLSMFRDNSYRTGIAGRFAYNFDDDWKLAGNYMFQNKGGDEKISTHGFGLDFSLDKKRINSDIGLFYVQDPEEGIRRRLQGRDELVYSAGIKWTGAYKFDIDNSEIEDIEPVVILGYFLPDFENKESHVLQTVIGVNVYLDDDLRVRFNGDLRLTKNEFISDYTTQNSRATLEIQARF